MNRRKPMNARQLAREKLLFRYSSALERGDFDTVAAVLREAETDPILERMLREINDVYRAEMQPTHAVSSLSANHNHRTGGEEHMTHITYPNPPISRRGTAAEMPRTRWNFAATLAAAMIALGVFAAVLIARRLPDQSEQGNPGVVAQIGTKTPTPAAQQPASSFTPTPNDGRPFATFTSTPVPFGTSADTANLSLMSAQGLCQGIVYMSGGVNLLSQPSVNGIVIGRLPGEQAVEVNIQQITPGADSNALWYFVDAHYGEEQALGWIRADVVALNSPCPEEAGGSSNPCAFITPGAFGSPTPTAFATQAGIELTATQAEVSAFDTIEATPTAYGAGPDGSEVFITPTFVAPCTAVPNLAITPTAGIPYGAWNSAMLRESVEGIPANTPVRIAAAYFNGAEWMYAVETLDQTMRAYAPESALIIYYPPQPTPTAVFDAALRSGGFEVLTLEQIGDIPANTRVQITAAQFDGGAWLYDILSQDQVAGQAREWQLQYEFGVTPGAPTPTAQFHSAIGVGFYAAITTEQVGNIPAGTLVHISSAFYDGIGWTYQIRDEAGRDNAARESQLALAPDYTPGMPTPTGAFFGRGNLVTLVQIGDIPAGTVVEATSGYYDGREWVYGITVVNGNTGGEARASQLRPASPGEGPATSTPMPTPIPSLTPTPAPTQ